MAIVLTSAEYACLVWCCSTHAQKLDMCLNETLRIVSGCLRTMHTHYLPVICRIAPFNLRQEATNRALVTKVGAFLDHILHKCLSTVADSGNKCLNPWHYFQRHAQSLIMNPQPINKRNKLLSAAPSGLKSFFPTPHVDLPPGVRLPRAHSVKLNCQLTGVGQFDASMSE